MIRSYQDLLERLWTARRAGVRLELGRMARLLERLGSPHRRLVTRVLIGGTNGKGSTAAFVDAVARHAGARTGLFTSPHLVAYRERFAVNGAPLGEDAILEAGIAVDTTIERDPALAGTTFFERTTAMALVAFAAAQVELAILEVGLGGRFDATNCVDAQVAAVTGVAFDHQAYLGSTLEAIAAEKAGIFNKGGRAVIGAAGLPQAVAGLEAAARAAGAGSVRRVELADLPETWPLGLAGDHQRANAACAVAIVQELGALGRLGASDIALRAGLAAAHLPGRLETVSLLPRVVLDGAHNGHAVTALLGWVTQTRRDRLLAVLGISADKDASEVLAPIARVADIVVATQSRQERALGAAEVAKAAATTSCSPPQVVPDVARAIEWARRRAGPQDLVLVAGSLYVVGEARAFLLGLESDPVPLADPVEKGAPAAARPAP